MAQPPFRLSVLDIGPIRSNQTAADCMASIVDLARHAEALGYHRYWLGEHHNVAAVAASQTAILSSVIASHTSSIRVGGCFLLAHYSPFLIAEQAAMVEACFPGRFDLGIGRSTGADRIASMMLKGGGPMSSGAEHPQALANLQALLNPAGAVLQLSDEEYRLCATSNAEAAPPMWILGTSAYSAHLAGELGLPYAFGYHITGEGVDEAFETYRRTFKPSAQCEVPTTLLSAIVVIGDTVEEAEKLARSQLYFMCAFRSGEHVDRQMLAEDAGEIEFPARYDDLLAMFRRTWIIDTPAGAAAQIAALAERLGVDEMMINPVAAAYRGDAPNTSPNRLRTLARLAEALIGE
jgi:luciferase family oxidoreductase group 1